MSGLALSLLGSFQATLDGKTIAGFESDRVRALLAYLAVESDRPHRRETLTGLLWPDWPDTSALTNLRNSLANLRKAIGDRESAVPAISANRETLQFNFSGGSWVDVHTFRSLTSPDQPIERLEEGIALYRGPFLEGFGLKDSPLFDEWQQRVRDHLQRQCLSALERVSEHYEQSGNLDKGIAAALKQVDLAPWQEEAHQRLMRLLALNGQRSAALAQYETCRQVLDKELGVPPSIATTALYEHILAGELVAAAHPSQTTTSRHSNLPEQLTPFIGRQREITQVRELLRAHRLVTLTGSGGVGKTRLSLQVAGQMLAEMPDGIWYLELAPISDPDRVPQSVAAALGLREDPNRPLMETLSEFLSSREILLVLDNCEHLLEACARLADALLRKAPRLKIFASSREALGIDGEYAFRVPSMSVPDPRRLPDLADLQEYESVRLFVERAQEVLPDFVVNERDAPAIAQICQRLDGIPLALELAAARLNLITPEQLASRLDSAFRLLTGGSRTALPRQQTLRAAIDWSYELLSTAERILLRRLAVFAGGSTLEAIEAVCEGEGLEAEQILDLLSGLVNKSMISANRSRPAETRYRLLETVRQYAREKLYEAKESQTFYDHHLDYYLELTEAVEPQLRTAIALQLLQSLEREVDNLRSALSWALDEMGSLKIEAGLRLASALLNFWHTQNYQNEGYTWLKKGLTTEDADPDPSDTKLWARACFASGHLLYPLGHTSEAQQWIEKSLAICKKIEDASGVVMAQGMLGEIYGLSGSFDEANALCETSLAACRTLNDPWLLAWVLCRYGKCLMDQGDNSQARRHLEESLAIFERLGDQLQVGDIFIMLGRLVRNQGEYQESNDYFHRALNSGRAMQSKYTVAMSLAYLGSIAQLQDKFNEMQVYLLESVALGHEMGSQHLPWFLRLLGLSEIHLGHPIQAVQYFKESLQIASSSNEVPDILLGMGRVALQMNQALIGAQLLAAGKRWADMKIPRPLPITQTEYERGCAEAKSQLDESAFERAISEGQALSQDEAVALALAVEIQAEPGDL